MTDKDLIKYTQNAIINKKPLTRIEDKLSADNIFKLVNNMDERDVNNYIRYYCNQHVDKVKSVPNAHLTGKVKSFSYQVYRLIAPKSSNFKKIYKLLEGCENTKRFVD